MYLEQHIHFRFVFLKQQHFLFHGTVISYKTKESFQINL